MGPSLEHRTPQRLVTVAVEISLLTTDDEYTVAGQKRRLRVQGKKCRNTQTKNDRLSSGLLQAVFTSTARPQAPALFLAQSAAETLAVLTHNYAY